MAALKASPPPEDLSWRRKGVTNLTIHVPSSMKSSSQLGSFSPKPSRWRSPEFFAYAIIFALALPYMLSSVLNLSKSSHPNYPSYRHRLSPGWLLGREVDTSDAQYRGFRSYFPALCGLALLHLGATHLNRIIRPQSSASSKPHLDLDFTFIFSIVMIIALHGLSALKILALLAINYTIAKSSRGHPLAIPATWAFNIAMLFGNEIYDGYKFASLHPILSIMDDFRGFYPRWNVTFNIAALRLIAFNVDYIWSTKEGPSNEPTEPLTERTRVSTAHPEAAYSFRNYLSYVLYPPLYIAGPIMTFNDFMWQVRQPPTITRSFRISYFVRFVISMLTMEFVLHYIYVVAIKDAKAWTNDSPLELAMIGFWNLVVMWLKLLIPWRFFRLWALLDGMEPQENMVRCVANNYSTLGFWRSWHRSYNLWLIRYIYVPLGGSNSAILPKLLVFTFVALWHDLSMRLLVWGWLITFIILPEVIATQLLPQSQYGGEWWYRHVCAFGGALNILLMMSANLIGFVLGTDGTGYLLGQIASSWGGWAFIVVTIGCLFVGVQVMFEYREEEKRRGIFRKC
ncbi:MBOAT-domain-containing protein [Clavulina sp. PMI_390]|nr:MBOAT-domain-containing protein [Clavulina sp. PMI_390]